MDRRIFLSSLLSLPVLTKAYAKAPWQARFASGNFDGEVYQAGLYITLEPGWKTYWRNPGEAGIPPQITATTADNLESLEIHYPLPKRYIDESGEVIGYHDEVLFPLALKPKDFTKPLKLTLEAFFGVCQQICTPAKMTGDLKIAPSSELNRDAALIATWQARVPKPATIATSHKLSDKALVLDLAKPFTDIFVEGPDRYYFTKPDLSRESGKAWFAIKGLKNPDDLKTAKLRITADNSGQGLEQVLTLV